MKNKHYLLIILILFCASVYGAISSKEAVQYIAEENNFMNPDEEYEQPNFTVTHGGEEYWVIPIVVDEEVTTFFAVNAKEKKFSDSRLTNAALFKTADIIREFLKQKEQVSKNPNMDWLVTNTYSRKFDNLSRFLGEEIYQLNTIETTMDDIQINVAIKDLKSRIEAMSKTASEVSKKISDALETESEILQKPKTNEINKLKDAYLEVFYYITKLDQEALNYKTAVGQLKAAISLSQMDASQKSFLINLANPPESFNEIGNYSITASTLGDLIESVYTNVLSRNENLVNEFESRIQRNNAYQILYGYSEDLAKIENSFTSLQKTVTIILSKENKPNWDAQGHVEILEEEWNNAELFFNRREYDVAIEHANRAANEAAHIYKKGFKIEEIKPLVSTELIYQIVGGLVVLLVVIYLIQNKDKLFKKEKEQGEVVKLAQEW